MISLIAILLPLLATTMAYPPFYPCNCGLGTGEEVCHSDTCSPLVIRPVDVPKPVIPPPKVVCAPVGGIPPLVPIKGPCTCHTSLVKPAVVPKPPCLACGGSVDLVHQKLTESQKQQLLLATGGAPVVAAPILVDDAINNPIDPANLVPADPVSLHVAYKLAQEECDTNEDKLAFGFRSIPKDVPLYVKRPGNNIAEENLYRLNGQIVELKAKKCSAVKSLDDEAKEQLIQLAEEEAERKLNEEAAAIKQVSLGEIGYGLAKIKEPVFVNVKQAAAADDDGLGQEVKGCFDGFKPGNVVIKEIPQPEQVDLPYPLPEPCGSEEDGAVDLPPGALFGNPYTYMASSSSSASSAKKSGVFFQKLCS